MATTSVSLAGTASSYLDVSIPLGSLFTIEWWQYRTDDNYESLIFYLQNNQLGWEEVVGSVYIRQNGFITNFPAPTTLNTWVNCCMVYDALSTLNMYVNGVLQDSVFIDGLNLTTLNLRIGNIYPTPGIDYAFGGQLYGFRVSSSARYSSNYTPSTSLPSVDGQTLLLLSGDNYVGTYGGDVVETNVTTSPNIPGSEPAVHCFGAMSRLLAWSMRTGIEEYVRITELEPGIHFLKTAEDGYKPLRHLHSSIISNPCTDDRTIHRLYKLPKNSFKELDEDLILTGGHGVLVQQLSDTQKEQSCEYYGNVYTTGSYFRWFPSLDSRAEPYTDKCGVGDQVVYHVVLDNSDEFLNYGIYCNGGLLVESLPRCKLEIV